MDNNGNIDYDKIMIVLFATDDYKSKWTLQLLRVTSSVI
jgi:hypothetical protein